MVSNSIHALVVHRHNNSTCSVLYMAGYKSRQTAVEITGTQKCRIIARAKATVLHKYFPRNTHPNDLNPIAITTAYK
jgi:hypothetical protein